MRVVLVTPYSWTTPGGANTHVASLAAELRARGHEVRVIAPADGPVPPGVSRVGRTVGVPFNGSVARLAFGPRVSARVRIALRRAHPDVIHIHEPFAPSASLLALVAARAPVVATFHAAMESRAYRAARVPLGRLWRKIAAPIAVSEPARATVEAVFGPGVRVIPNGVDCARFARVPPPDPLSRTVVYIGRLEKRKGPQVLAEAAPDLLRRVEGSKVVFAGEGAMRKSLEASIPDEMRDRVTFAGRYDDVGEAVAPAAVVALPAIGGESFGLTLVEAMAAGRAVVASSIAGYASVAAGSDGVVLVQPGDRDALVDALAGVMTGEGEAAGRGAAARADAARFDWPIVASRIEEVYREVVEAAGDRRAG